MADNESKLSLENARRVAGLLRPLSPQARNDLLIAKRDGDFPSFQKVAFENRLDANSIWTGIDDIWQQTAQGAEIPIEGSDPLISSSDSKGPGTVGTGALAARALLDRKEGTYERFQEDSERYGKHAFDTWEEEEKERLKNPAKFKPRPGRAIDAQEAYDRAHREYHEMFTRGDRKKAEEWYKKNPTNISLALAINKVSVENKKLTYEELKKIRESHAKTIESDWNSRDPSKRSRDRAYMLVQAREEINDHLAFTSPETVKKWAAQYNDPELDAALERKRQRDEAQAITDQGRMSKLLGRNPAARFAAQPETAPPQINPPRTPLPVLNPTFQPKPETEATVTDQSEDKQAANTTNQKKGMRNKLNYYSPSQIGEKARTRIKNRIIDSKIGQKFKNSRIGKLSSKLNRLNGSASKVIRKIKNLLNPLSYLLNLIKRSLIGSVVSALASALTTVLSFTVSTLVGTITAAVGVFSATLGVAISTVGLPGLIILLIVALLVIVFVVVSPCIIFCDQETRVFIDSPYPGISYSILAPETLPNDSDIVYSIVVLVDTAKAQDAPQELTTVANIPPGTSFVSASGTYSLADPGKIKWKLYPENSTPENEGKIILSFAFNLTVRPENDIVVENTLLIEGASGGAPPPSGIAPNDIYCEDRKYAYVLSNKLLAKNYGDPDCTLDTYRERNDLYDYLKQKDPEWADFWFNVIIPGESSYAPNNWGCGDFDAAWDPVEKRCREPWAPRGAWGLFQMGSSNPPGELKARGGTRGDVTWKEQVDNAINHNKAIDKLGLRFRYWQVAIEWCKDGNMSKPQCRDM